jgi:hypothetical protein
VGTLSYGQAPDTSTLEKKARWHYGQLKDNKARAITPLHFRKAFNAVTNLALQTIIPDTSTHPPFTWAPEDYPEGLSMYYIMTQDGWPFFGTLFVEKNADGHVVQTITANDAPFLDQRKRSSNADGGLFTWGEWDVMQVTVNYDPPSIPPGDIHQIDVSVPGLHRYARVKRLFVSVDTSPVRVNASVNFNADGSLTVYSYNGDSVNPVNPNPVSVSIFIEN